jgi:DNA-binding response OmpR family regulator
MGGTGPRVLVAAKDEQWRRELCSDLRQQGLQVLEVSNGVDALACLRSAGVDVAMVDLELSEIGGLELVRRLRRESMVPIILLSRQRDEPAGIAGLDAGADEFLLVPCSADEVGARARALLRRARSFEAEPSVLRSGLVELDLEARRCRAGGREVRLTRREFDLLSALLRYEGRIHTRSQLLELVWGGERVTPKTVDVHVASLRRKLGGGVRLTTVRGVGYRVEPPAAAAETLPDTASPQPVG